MRWSWAGTAPTLVGCWEGPRLCQSCERLGSERSTVGREARYTPCVTFPQTEVLTQQPERAHGALPELLRLGPARRPVFGMHLEERVPSLLNSPGIDALDGVPVGPPRWNENKPLRKLPPLVNNVAGAMPIQELIDRSEWAFQSGNSLAYAPHLRRDPLPGVPEKSVLLQFAKGDQTSPNPAMTAFLRASGLANRTTFYRNDLALANPDGAGVPKNPHGFLNN